MSYITDLFSLIGGAYKLLIDVPLLGIGILVGGFGYRFLLQKNPALLAKLVASVGTEVSTLTADAKKVAASATSTSSTPATGSDTTK